MRLVHVQIKLRAMYEQFPKLPHSTKSERLFRRLVRENIIIQFFNFIKIRNDLIKDPKIKSVDESVKPLWETMIKFQEPITQIRHEYIAHIQLGKEDEVAKSIRKLERVTKVIRTNGAYEMIVEIEGNGKETTDTITQEK